MLHIAGLISILWLAPAEVPRAASDWLRDYRDGLRSELIDGNLVEAVAAYRRVAVSRAPLFYVQRARYRLAGTLMRLDRNDEARDVLRKLYEELSPSAALRPDVARRLTRLAAGRRRLLSEWVAQLERARSGHDTDRLHEAAAALARREGADGATALLAAYRALPADHAARSMLLPHLANSAWPAAVPAIREALDDTNPTIRAAAARAVGMVGDAGSIGRFVGLLADHQAQVRRAAAWSLGQLRYLGATARLAALAGADADPDVRKMAIDVLRCFGSPHARRALSGLGAADVAGPCERPFSSWYRRACAETAEPQLDFPDSTASDRRATAPRIGVVVSAMTQHGPVCCAKRFQPYAAQVRKAWTLQRAGFNVCLLAEPEVLIDPVAPALGTLFGPELKIFPLGSWPACDVMILDQLVHLPRAVVSTVRAFCAAGGGLLVCGAAGGGWCGDRVTWQQVVGVRRLRAGHLDREAIAMTWCDPSAALSLAKHGLANGISAGAAGVSHRGVDGTFPPWPRSAERDRFDAPRDDGVSRQPRPRSDAPAVWVMRRSGTFFARDVLAGRILAQYDSPRLWAIKYHRLGRGRVLCVNWDIGLNVTGARDEDELLGRCVDMLVGTDRKWTSPHYRVMHQRRWGDLTAAKQCIERAALASLSRAERWETLAQLYRIYLLENNRIAGQHVCRRWFDEFGAVGAGQAVLQHVDCCPKHIQMALAVGTHYVWWRDVPGWLIPRKGLPLWLVGPGKLPARVRLRAAVPTRRSGRPRLVLNESRVTTVGEHWRQQVCPNGIVEITHRATGPGDAAIDAELAMTGWTARVRIENVVSKRRETDDGS